jgi:hypothetical protein
MDSGMTAVAKEIPGQARNDRGAYCYFWKNTNKNTLENMEMFVYKRYIFAGKKYGTHC